MIEWAQKAISLPVSLVSPRPLFDRNHCLLSSTNETRQMGTFKAVPQSAVMRSNSWWRGVSSLRAVWDGWPGARRRGGASRRRLGWMAGGRAAEGCAASPGGGGRRFTTGRWFRTAPNFAASTCARPRPPGLATTWLRASEPPSKILVGRAPARPGSCAASAGHRRSCDHVKTSVGVAAAPDAARFGQLTTPNCNQVDGVTGPCACPLLCILRRCLRSSNELAGVR